jgi:gamma-glutamylcyclotransferase (GGCT)/AIG2-like uncharacterized protein YtfP
MSKTKVTVIAPKHNEHDRYHVLVYGSLRKNCKNHQIISSQKDSKFIKTISIQDWTLYMHKGADYPYAAYKYEAKLTCELWHVSEETIKAIRHLEKGYMERTIVPQITEYDTGRDLPHTFTNPVCSFFIQPLSQIQKWQSDPNFIEIGHDWVKHCKETNNFCYVPNVKNARKAISGNNKITS